MAFVPLIRGTNGGNGYVSWGVSCTTVQDFQADPTGNTIYATGTLTVKFIGGAVQQFTQDNRGFSISSTGQTVLRPPFYGLADAQKCINQLFQQLCMMGRQFG